MDWNKALILAGQIVCVVTLGTLVGLGHNSAVTDALLAVTGSVAGVGIYTAVRTKSDTSAGE